MSYFNLDVLINNNWFKVMCILIVMDTIFGILRALRERQTNSAIGIDGIIRKAGMLITIVFFNAIDDILSINLIGFIPEELRNYVNLEKIGINELFSILFALFELLSIFKNMILCKLPVIYKLLTPLEKIIKEFTGEFNDKKETVQKVAETIVKASEIVNDKEKEEI